MAQHLNTSIQDPQQIPGWLVTSAAIRAKQTSDFIARAFAVPHEHICIDRSLYLADPETLFDALKETPAEQNCVALIAHNPGLTWLVNSLSDANEQLENLPTLGCALFSCEVSDWSELNRANCVLLLTPKKVGRKRKR